jgi:hypothetical protein
VHYNVPTPHLALLCPNHTCRYQGANIYHLDGPTKAADWKENSTNFTFLLLGYLYISLIYWYIWLIYWYIFDWYIDIFDWYSQFQHERNTIQLHVQVFLGMNTWMFEICRRRCNYIRTLMWKVCILLVLITQALKLKQLYLSGHMQGHVRNSLPREKITHIYFAECV